MSFIHSIFINISVHTATTYAKYSDVVSSHVYPNTTSSNYTLHSNHPESLHRLDFSSSLPILYYLYVYLLSQIYHESLIIGVQRSIYKMLMLMFLYCCLFRIV